MFLDSRPSHRKASFAETSKVMRAIAMQVGKVLMAVEPRKQKKQCNNQKGK